MYLWYNLKKDVRAFRKSYSSCFTHKSNIAPCPEGRGSVPVDGKPFQQWAVDIVELPQTVEGYMYVLVVTDMLPKLLELLLSKHKKLKRLLPVCCR